MSLRRGIFALTKSDDDDFDVARLGFGEYEANWSIDFGLLTLDTDRPWTFILGHPAVLSTLMMKN